ncbi:hypothetical protein ABRQ00_07875 [Pectobacterium aroidearum]|uniref:DUF943 family protein n=1 Tax=Pectobacterium aroidearum TaxID=1201031 RepID=A0AAW3SU88_9GAMM|nr:hypothetical protein [Pectobacterium aroidearum]MBA5203607.1 hypothetical protein [Pectobacterium aroidearum]MBA5235520.1 hypothetical protein [Pectobacterium aroidearum]UUE59689.1 hypothetical protein L0Y27_10650 [Pectobacterium aroidearum]UUE68394.1 hypothetical protein L0Y21_11320 [Pectobacterium aroidearum]UUE72760.1 hypothetical protein L0Y20_11425 [Pectobacterium aroidearum]
MSKPLKMFAIIGIIVVAAVIGTIWPYVKMNFASSAHYSEQDEREYAFYTPDILKNMPRITARYDFNFSNVTGPEAKVWTVNFYGTDDIGKVHGYLISAGYEKQERCDVEAECWRVAGTNEVVTVATFDTDKSVMVQVYSSPYIEPLSAK